MIERIGSFFPLLLLALLAALSFWLERVLQPSGTPGTAALRHEPDYIVDGLSATRMDELGRVKHTLRARRMTHYPDDDVTVLVDPRLVTYSQGRAPVTVTSRDAHMSGNGENVYFENDVRVVRAAVGNQSELTLETPYLHVIPDDNVAKTDRPVTIRNAMGVVNASGLELNSETRVLKLSGRVKGVYRPAGSNAR
jgi:lipopolysaccharide export system protein LptC